MSNSQAADLLRKAADALIQGAGGNESASRTVTVTNTTSSTSTTAALRNLFGSYTNKAHGGSTMARRISSSSTTYWTHTFFALANSSQVDIVMTYSSRD